MYPSKLCTNFRQAISPSKETKVSAVALNKLESYLLGDPEHWESYWGFCQTRKGYSGVATYVRKGLVVASQSTFGTKEFDDEGRIVMTEFPDFCLYNIYFPNAGLV